MVKAKAKRNSLCGSTLTCILSFFVTNMGNAEITCSVGLSFYTFVLIPAPTELYLLTFVVVSSFDACEKIHCLILKLRGTFTETIDLIIGRIKIYRLHLFLLENHILTFKIMPQLNPPGFVSYQFNRQIHFDNYRFLSTKIDSI